MSSNVFKFTGARSLHYDNLLGPFLFEPFGREMASRIPTQIQSALEIAAGTGRVTRHLRNHLPASVKLVASDLSPDMLEIAKTKIAPDQNVEWVIADMQELPFENNSFDVVVCQYGIMFPPDKNRVFEEVHRVLRPGGKFFCSTWEKTDRVPIFKTVYNESVVPFFTGEDTSRFFVPFSLYDIELLTSFYVNAGFQQPRIEKVTLTGKSPSAHDLVQGFFMTHAVGQEVADRDQRAFETIAQKMEEAIIQKFNNNPVVCDLTSYFGLGVKLLP